MSYIFIRGQDRITKMNPFDILFLESAGNYVKIYTVREKEVVMIRARIKALEGKLRHSLFKRSARGYIANIHHVDFVEKDIIRIARHDIPLQKKYATEFLQAIMPIN